MLRFTADHEWLRIGRGNGCFRRGRTSRRSGDGTGLGRPALAVVATACGRDEAQNCGGEQQSPAPC